MKELHIDEVTNLITQVGLWLLKVQKNHQNTGHWEGAQFKSEADLYASNLYIEGLKKLTPNIPIIDEEQLSSHQLVNLPEYWLVDPIDGTASFCEGFEGYATQLALVRAGKPILGWVFCPSKQILYFAEYGGGAYLNGHQMPKLKKTSSLAITDNTPEPTGLTSQIYKKFSCSNYIESGSIGVKICLVAEGIAQIFVKDIVYKEWDIAPARLILNEVGGVILDFNGLKKTSIDKLIHESGLVVCSAEALASEIITYIGTTSNEY